MFALPIRIKLNQQEIKVTIYRDLDFIKNFLNYSHVAKGINACMIL